jgi:hypothetical protein
MLDCSKCILLPQGNTPTKKVLIFSLYDSGWLPREVWAFVTSFSIFILALKPEYFSE